MSSTIRSIFTLRSPALSTFFLVILWSLSPLGSQASLRAAYMTERSTTVTQEIKYTHWSIEWQRKKPIQQKMLPRNIYFTALLDMTSGLQYSNGTSDSFDQLVGAFGGNRTAASQSATDTWGNIRIPNLRQLPGGNLMNSTEWIEVSWKENVLNYSSLIGIPSSRLTVQEGVSNYTITAGYHSFNVSVRRAQCHLRS